MIDGLKPCPACGGTDIRICYERDGKWCGCMNCNLGIIRFNPDAAEKAAEHWNGISRDRPVDISPDKLKPDAEAIQEILARHLGGECQCSGLGAASFGIARYIAKRIAAIQTS